MHLSEGYPHFIQQFAHSVFAADTDNVIDAHDVVSGVLGRRGAMELIGDRYYRDSYYNKIQKDSYRQVLRIMADKAGRLGHQEGNQEQIQGAGLNIGQCAACA